MPRRSSSLIQVVDGAIDREINSKYDNVRAVADNIDAVVTVSGMSLDNVAIVAGSNTQINAIAGNLPELLQVDTNAALAVDAKSGAEVAQLAAETSAVDAAASAVTASTAANMVASLIDEVHSLSANATSLASGEEATAIYDEATGVISFGIPVGLAGADGSSGASAYEVAVAAGFAGTEAEWLASLVGEQGIQGITGAQGIQGVAGAQGLPGEDGTSITNVTSSKVGNTTTVTVDGNFVNAPYMFDILDGANGAGTGDMLISIYDTNNNGIVDNAELVNGLTVETAVPVGAVFTDTVYDDTVVVGRIDGLETAKHTHTNKMLLDGIDQGLSTESDVSFATVYASAIQLVGGTGTQGQLTWNSDEETLDLVNNGAVLQLGQELFWHVRNGTGVTITNGTAVMVTGTLGASGRLVVAPMVANGSVEEYYLLGIATEDIGAGEDGKVTHFGKVRGVNTTAWEEGDTLYVDPSNPGKLTNVLPSVPSLKLLVGIVIYKGINGTLAVRVQTGSELDELHDVAIVNVQDGDVLTYEVASGVWKNKATVNSVDLSATANATEVTVVSSAGADAILGSASDTNAGVMTAADKSKLDGVAVGATANVGTVTSITTSGAITGGTITDSGTIGHSTDDGYLHVPATGTTNTGKVLTAGASAGSISWEDAATGSEHYDQEGVPTGATAGATWYVPSTGKLYTLVNDGVSLVWVDDASGAMGVTQDYVDSAIATVVGAVVVSVAGKTGEVTLDTVDISGLNTALGLKADTSTVNTALATKANLSNPTIVGLKETSVAMVANDIDLSLGNLFTKTITGATTLTVSNVPTSGTVGYFILRLTNGGAGAVTYPSGTKWSKGTAPTLTASGIDLLRFVTIDGGTRWEASRIQEDSK